jgi:hypothetical protein
MLRPRSGIPSSLRQKHARRDRDRCQLGAQLEAGRREQACEGAGARVAASLLDARHHRLGGPRAPDRDAPARDRAVAAAASREPSILAAYIFGSRARGEAGTKSDLDVAVLETLGASLDIESKDRLRRSIAQATGLRVDLARLRPSQPVLAFEVLEGGHRVYERNAERADEIEENLLRRYLDTEHLRRVQREYFFGDRR